MQTKEDDVKAANDSLMNWGRAMVDSYLEHHLLIAPPPTSEGYRAPMVVYDEPEPIKTPVDLIDAKVSEHVIVAIGCEYGGFDVYRVLVKYYTRLVFCECTQEERLKRLSRHMRCSYPGARRMLNDAQILFWDRRQTIDGLMRQVANFDRKAYFR